MCWRKKEVVLTPAEMRILSFGRNQYGGGNNLNGCVNDTTNLTRLLQPPFPDIDIRKYTDYDVTVANYKKWAATAIATLSPGATVAIIADSCFSQGITRGNPNYGFYNGHPYKE